MSATPDQILAAAFDAAQRAIEQTDDADEAFRIIAAFSAEYKARSEDIQRLRALAAKRVRDQHKLSLRVLAERLSDEGYPVTHQRLSQMIGKVED